MHAVRNKSYTLPIESNFNYTALDVAPNGSALLAVNEKGEAQMISLHTCTVIHKYKFKTQVNAVKFSPDGKYFAACCKDTGEQYAMKQQGHSLDMTCVAYSPDGLYLVWNASTGFCFVTFSEHSSTVTSIVFSANKKFFITSSLDGTVRCYDLMRYRNFRTLSSPTLVQFGSAALDASGELAAAAGHDVFEVYLWSVKFGKLLDVLGGHEAPVSSLAFSPTLSSSKLVSASWDKTIRVWDAIENSTSCETIQLTSDALQIVFRPDGEQMAVSTLDGNITFFNTTSGEQVGCIEGRSDLGSGKADTDLITAQKMLKTKAFTTICYSADGSCVLGGGNSKHVCLYSVNECVLIKKFVVTQNLSLDAVNDFINRRLLTEFGNMALIEERTEYEGGDVRVRLPGVKGGDMADRQVKPEVRVHCVRFSPTGESFVAATTEGLLIYSQNAGIDGTFRPYRLTSTSTPAAVRNWLAEGSWGSALSAALQLNEMTLIQQCVESVPPDDIALTVSGLESDYCDLLLGALARLLEESRHLEHLLLWVEPVISLQKKNYSPSVLLAVEKILALKYSQLCKICDFNKYTIQCIKKVAQMAPKVEDEEMDVSDHSSGRGTFSDTD
ncbi:hypothetical protein ACJJTC_011342 [Scirpophaga incertulas]